MALTKKEKLQKLAEISSAESKNPHWKDIAKWNRDHADTLDDFVMIAHRILQCLKQKGISQRELAKQLGVSPQALTKIVKGRRNLTLSTIRKIEKALEIDLINIVPPVTTTLSPSIKTNIKIAPVMIYYNKQMITQGTQPLGGHDSVASTADSKLKIA